MTSIVAMSDLRQWLVVAFALAVTGVGCGSSNLTDGGGADAGTTFSCGANADCVRGSEYCFSEEWNGAQKVGPACRALPAGCSTCTCAQPDAITVSLDCKSPGTLTCIENGMVIGYDTSSPTLTLACMIP